MQRLHYTVIKDINAVDSSHNSSTSKQCKKVLGSLKIGETIEARQFVKETIPKFCKTVNPILATDTLEKVKKLECY